VSAGSDPASPSSTTTALLLEPNRREGPDPMSEPRIDYDSAVATGRGDDGTTALLFGGDRVSKDDLRTEAYGAVDEAVATLGLARAELSAMAADDRLTPRLARLNEIVLRIQRELFVVGAELATNPQAHDKARDDLTRVSARMVSGIDELLREVEAQVEMPREFVVPGETRLSAALEVGRTVLRRAERRAVTLANDDEGLAGSRLLRYLNRLADLLWVLARAAEQAEAHAATVARPDRQAAPRTPADTAQRSER
jgi:cob(I)alamin adenosyltransferase